MTKTNRERLTDLQEDLEKIESRFETVKKKLLSNEKFLEQIQNHKNNSQKWKNEIETYKKQSSNHANNIENLKKDIVSTKESLEKQLNSTEVKKEDLDKFFIRVFGEENKKGEREGGLAQRLEKKENEIDDFIEKQQDRYEKLYTKIESLLPAATSTGLAKAYFDQKDSYKTPIKIWGSTFVVALTGIVLIGLFNYNGSGFNFILSEPEALDQSFSRVLSRTPFYFALIWLAAFSSKRYRQNKRLEEEYAHKEVLAKSYQGYKNEFETEKEAKNDGLVEDLKKVLLQAISKNPSEIIDDGKEEDSPSIFQNPLDGLKGDNSKSK